ICSATARWKVRTAAASSLNIFMSCSARRTTSSRAGFRTARRSWDRSRSFWGQESDAACGLARPLSRKRQMQKMNAPYDSRLPPDLRALKQDIEAHAREYGLDFYETIFEVVDADDLNEIAAYGGFPTRYPHWSFGMQYEELKKGYE